MFRNMLLAVTGIVAAGVVALSVLSIPLLRRLPRQRRVSLDGVTSIEDAVEACRRTHLQGGDLRLFR